MVVGAAFKNVSDYCSTQRSLCLRPEEFPTVIWYDVRPHDIRWQVRDPSQQRVQHVAAPRVLLAARAGDAHEQLVAPGVALILSQAQEGEHLVRSVQWSLPIPL